MGRNRALAWEAGPGVPGHVTLGILFISVSPHGI